ncbi:MAG: putative toxin-antitoxin system toxin component, PIN family [Spirochaetia bacterium]|jgi:putative PIN family toxin of toxin-antitoxin system
MRVVLDTNVVLSAILFGGKPKQVIEAALAGSIHLFASESMISELRGVLQRPKFGFSAQHVQGIVSEFAGITEWIEPKEHFEMMAEDPTDNQFIDCAMAIRADYLVTGDCHLLRLGKCGNTQIVNPDSFVGILAKGKVNRKSSSFTAPPK